MDIIRRIEQTMMREDVPPVEVGDTVRVKWRFTERDRSGEDKSRVQAYEGIVIAKKGTGISESIVVRKISSGVGVEKTFPLHSPNLVDLEVVTRGKVRRAKLYYLREKKHLVVKKKSRF
ncbi:MAG TPA: 50S ribosomal protein L19 [Coprothermobacter proteolyticus]|uniref:Large ribosomal subunit protein bL19 n=1 Tax=Coprothermobacter proteolyticus (strain ATCC 35245 / DSM 5265 / OCM 4 / BT) TaxID=309798 RepID=RL19_COPPD|nr:50S ribosomal protein L19 [Coprothermobacter proteolyticus]B5Y8F5.1 RecName: Full=Large ribosomal subunit protein bL19; AltName: Full=50S ribosomal protein L19 [Coprothermobacter proteolyticus DSM 5265]MBK6585681.1 50S ribosomal protein L19 [Coprothermobacter sp.]ACI17905.1 50S ribosomal protein L19 [Coprothermobacter proteolyticus DSM 5265]MBP8983147.1 50S ribosomal protein L19 [Coprothermobacter sp.]NLT83851.1 50S ribosomal protein L19 [Coprothermobacter proteolyticus]HOA64445.1 50S ribo